MSHHTRDLKGDLYTRTGKASPESWEPAPPSTPSSWGWLLVGPTPVPAAGVVGRQWAGVATGLVARCVIVSPQLGGFGRGGR